jgi:hypothetical protein
MPLKPFLSCALFAVASATTLCAGSIPYGNVGEITPFVTFTAVSSGDLMAYFYDSGATFNEDLGLFVNGVQQGGYALEDHASSFGDSVNFGHVNAGDDIVFALRVADTNYTLYSDLFGNPDFVSHVYTTSFAGETRGDITIPAGTFVGFEDSLLPFSDFNYNDEAFVFTNVSSTVVTPEPGSPLLLAGGALVIALGILRKKSK